ncbi:MAG: hypothetical protein O6844_01200 [Gammaproteobacteria bacterium]|nr:hypothetical protein [Gammaproteobacteria bacterium]
MPLGLVSLGPGALLCGLLDPLTGRVHGMDSANRTNSGGFFFLAAIACLLSGCFSSSAQEEVVVEGNLAIVFVQRGVNAVGNPTDGIIFEAGGDLMTMDLSSPSATLVNLTEAYTLGAGDVSDPEVSFDGQRVLFSMRGPNDPTWNIFEYEMATDTLTRIVADALVADAGDDVDPAYLPDGRIVFSSNRQEKSRQILSAENTEQFAYLDEYERERSIVLHVMNADGSDIHQISYNQSHDRNPTVLNTGEIIFARWDHVGDRNHFPIFFTNPDGTNIFVQYGAFSPGNSMLHPREMPDGRVMSSLMPLSGTFEGGAVVAVDIQNFSDLNDPAPSAPVGAVGQVEVTPFMINFGDGISANGRFTTPYPLWDGTNRALLSWSPFRSEMETDPLTGAQNEVEGAPLYGIYMLDMDTNSMRPVALPPEGTAYTDPIPVQARPVPSTIADKLLDAALAAQGLGIINVKSVYDTDGQDLMGASMLIAGENIPMTAPPAGDLRTMVADLATIKDPVLTNAAGRVGRFIRVTRAVSTPAGISMGAIGQTDLEMQRIVGYGVEEPDGSFRLKVPADIALGVAVVDSNGRAFQTHTNWLQVRPGETRTCNGCHSPRRGSALNSAAIAGNHPNTLMQAQSGESMAETRTRLDPQVMDLTADMVFQDVWTDPALRAPDPDLVLDYTGLTTPAPANGLIDYPDHIAPLWTKDRGADTCVDCHNSNFLNDPVSIGLDLRRVFSGTGRLLSYDELLIGDPFIDSATGRPVLLVNNGQIQVRRRAPLVATGDSRQSSRTSHLVEKIYEQELRAGRTLAVSTVDHSGMMNASERRLIAEWIDLGAQYYNNPFDDTNGDGFFSLSEVRGGLRSLSESEFNALVHPILMARCASCHQPFTGNGTPSNPQNPGFLPNRFVLTGNRQGDFNVTLSMVDNVCMPEQSSLLKRPVSDELSNPPHPRIDDPNVVDDPNDPLADDVPVMAVGEPDYQTIYNWIAGGVCIP